MRDHKPTIHNMTDLEAYYNWQLPEVSGLIQESVGVTRKAIKTIVQIILTLNHYICTYFGVRNKKYSRESD